MEVGFWWKSSPVVVVSGSRYVLYDSVKTSNDCRSECLTRRKYRIISTLSREPNNLAYCLKSACLIFGGGGGGGGGIFLLIVGLLLNYM